MQERVVIPYPDGRVTTDGVSYSRATLRSALSRGQGAVYRIDLSELFVGPIQYGQVSTRNAIISDLTDYSVALIVDPDTDSRDVEVSFLSTSGEQWASTLTVERTGRGVTLGGLVVSIGYSVGADFAGRLRALRTKLDEWFPLEIDGMRIDTGNGVPLGYAEPSTRTLDYEVLRS